MTNYSQMDSRWANDILGYNVDSRFNMYNYGCLVTCLAMILKEADVPINPGELNEFLKRNNGFAPGTGYYVWGSCNRLYEEILEERIVYTPDRLTDAQMAEIRSSIDAKKPVMLQLDYNPKTVENETHYVLCESYDPQDENNITIIDPLGGKRRSLKDYLGWFRPSARNTIHQYIIYGVALSDCQKIKNELEKIKLEMLEQSKNHRKELDDRNNKIISLSNDVLAKTEEIKKLENTILPLSNKISDQEILIDQLRTQSISQLTVGELIKLIIKKIIS